MASFDVGIVVGIFVLVLVILILVSIIVYLILKSGKGGRKKSKTKEETQPKKIPPAPANLTNPEEDKQFRVDVDLQKFWLKVDQLEVDPKLLKAEFNYVEKKSKQYERANPAIYTVAKHQANKQRNRYGNVLPADRTRVKLKPIESEPETHYINADWIEGSDMNQRRKYIACQGPLDNTIIDMWRMVWQTNASVIMMFTNVIESEKVKCATYWPQLDEPVHTDKLKVVLEEEKKLFDDVVVRKIKLIEQIAVEEKEEDHKKEEKKEDSKEEESKKEEDSKKEVNEEKKEETETESETPNKPKKPTIVYKKGAEQLVTHYQYIGWPDHGIPDDNETFIQLAKESDKANTSGGPLIVHCSAGIGRTGTYILIQNILQKVELCLKNKVDEKDIKVNLVRDLLRLRKQRPGLVQTEEQYMFVYLTVLQGLKDLKVTLEAPPPREEEKTIDLEDEKDDDEKDEKDSKDGKEEKKG